MKNRDVTTMKAARVEAEGGGETAGELLTWAMAMK